MTAASPMVFTRSDERKIAKAVCLKFKKAEKKQI